MIEEQMTKGKVTKKPQDITYYNTLAIKFYLSENNISPDMLITLEDIENVISCFKHQPFSYKTFQYIYTSPHAFQYNTFNSDSILKYILISIYYRFLTNYSINQLLEGLPECTKVFTKLYKDHLFTINDILIICKFLLILSMAKKSEVNYKRKQKPINEVKLVIISFNLLSSCYDINETLSDDNIYSLLSFLDYFEKYVISIPCNRIIVSKAVKYFPFSSLIKKDFSNSQLVKVLVDNLLCLYRQMFKFAFNEYLMKDLIEQVKDCLINYNTRAYSVLRRDLRLMNMQVNYLMNSYQNETSDNRQDPYLITNGFYYQNNSKNGILVSFKEIKCMSILLSFKCYEPSVNQRETMTLISFYQKSTNELIIAHIVYKNSLVVEYYEKTRKEYRKDLLIPSLNNSITYQLMIEMNYLKSDKRIHLNTIANSQPLSKEVEILCKFNDHELDCFIGCGIEKATTVNNKPIVKTSKEGVHYNTANYYQGEIGPVLFYSSILSKDEQYYLLQLKGAYEDSLLYERFNMDYIRKYQSKEKAIEKAYMTACDFFKENKSKYFFNKSFLCIVSSQNFKKGENDSQLNELLGEKVKTRFPFRYINFSNSILIQELKAILIAPLSNELVLFKRNGILFEFLKLNGINFLSLHLEYYHQLLSQLSLVIEEDNSGEQKEIINCIYGNIDNILLLISRVLNEIHLEEYHDELKPLFHVLSKALDKITTLRKLTKKEIYITLVNLFVAIKNEILVLEDHEHDYDKDNESLDSHGPLTKMKAMTDFRCQLIYLLLNHQYYDINDHELLGSLFDTFINFYSCSPHEDTLNTSIMQRLLDFSMILNRSTTQVINDDNDDHYLFSTDIPSNENESSLTILKKTYINLLLTFLSADKTNKLMEDLCYWLGEDNISQELLYTFITLFYYNSKFSDMITNLGPLNTSLMKKIKCCNEKTFIMIILLYVNMYNNSGIKRENADYVKIIEFFLFSEVRSSHFLIKALLISLYKTQLTNEEKIKYTYDIQGFPSLQSNDKPLTYDEESSMIIIQLSFDLFNMIKTDKDLANNQEQCFEVLYSLIKTLLNLPFNHRLFQDFFKKGNNSFYLLYKSNKSIALRLEGLCDKMRPLLLKGHPDPFIFDFLYQLSKENHYEKFVIKEIWAIIKELDAMSQENDKRFLVYNIANLFIYYYRESTNDSDESLLRFDDFQEILPKSIILLEISKLMMIKTLFPVGYEKKLMCEMVFDIIFNPMIFANINAQIHILTTFNILFRVQSKIITDSVFYQLDMVKGKELTAEEKEIFRLEQDYYHMNDLYEHQVTIHFLTIVFKRLKDYPFIETNMEMGNESDGNILHKSIDEYGLVLFKTAVIIVKESLNNKCKLKSNDQGAYDFIVAYLEQKLNCDYIQFKESYDDYVKKSLRSFFKKPSNISSKSNIVQLGKSDKSLMSLARNNTFANSSYLKEKDNEENYLPKVQNITSIRQKDFIHFQHVRYEGMILNSKKHFFTKHFSQYFKDVFFYNQKFIDMKTHYINNYNCNPSSKYLDYPSTKKKYTNDNNPHLFFKQNMNFFTSDYFPISHKYYVDKASKCEDKQITFQQHLPYEGLNDDHMQIPCENINGLAGIFGYLNIYDHLMTFQPINDKESRKGYDQMSFEYLFSSLAFDRKSSTKLHIIHFKDIKEILIRRFILLWQAVEIFLHNGKSYFFNFFHTNNNMKFFDKMKSYPKYNWKIITKSQEYFVNEKYTRKVIDKEMPLYEYLLAVNKYSSRTYNDYNQYYIFPWLLLTYKKEVIEESTLDKANMRNFKRLYSLQNDDMFNKSKMKTQESDTRDPHENCGEHYSTSSFIFNYLMRNSPYTEQLIKLQNMQQENSNRMLQSFDEFVKMLTSQSFNRESIPEHFCSIEFMINLNCVDFGARAKTNQVDDMQFPEGLGLSEYVSLIFNQRRLLNTPLIKENIIHWIDGVFGPNQYDKKNKDPSFAMKNETYEHLTNYNSRRRDFIKEKLSGIKTNNSIIEDINFTINFGSTPSQLFTNEHQKLYNKTRLNDSFEELMEMKEQSKEIFLKKNAISIKLIKEHAVILTRYKNIEISPPSEKTIEIKLQIFSIGYRKYFSSSEKEKLPLFNQNNTFCVLNTNAKVEEWIFVIGRYLDHSMKIHQYKLKGHILEIMTEDFICSLASIDQMSFLTGMRNGKLIHWELVLDHTHSDNKRYYKEFLCKLHQRKYVIAHESEVNVIVVNQSLGIVITSGSDHCIYIRKLYDFELLTVIHESPLMITTDIVVSPINFIYVLSYSPTNKMSRITGYTMTGIKFATSLMGNYCSIALTDTSRLMVNCLGDNYITIYSPCTLMEENRITDNNWKNPFHMFDYQKNLIVCAGYQQKYQRTIITDKLIYD